MDTFTMHVEHTSGEVAARGRCPVGVAVDWDNF